MLTGAIIPFGGTSVPAGYLACDGATYLQTDYPALYAIIGNNYGGPPSHFNVPDLRGRSPMGYGTGPGLSTRAIGQNVGEETHQLTVTELAAHKHTFEGGGFSGAVWLNQNSGNNLGSGSAFANVGTMDNTGGDTAHNTVHPVQCIAFVIKT